MADKTRDPYYERLEALIDKLLTVGEVMPADSILANLIEHPERYGSMLSALYRARAMTRPGEQLIPDDMSDSQLEDELRRAGIVLPDTGNDVPIDLSARRAVRG